MLASNFQFDADVDCCRKDGECCCQYPKLIVSVKHQYEGENLASGKVYHTALGQPFRLQSIRFLASGIQLIENEESVSIIDLLEIQSGGQNTMLVPDDFTVFSSAKFSFTIGDFIRPGSYTSLHFNIGVDDVVEMTDPTQFDADHALGQGSNGMRDSTGPLLLYDIAWIPDTTTMEVVNLQMRADQLAPVIVPLEGDKPAGISITIPLVIEYALWFREIDIGEDSFELQKEKILEGMSQSFSIL